MLKKQTLLYILIKSVLDKLLASIIKPEYYCIRVTLKKWKDISVNYDIETGGSSYLEKERDLFTRCIYYICLFRRALTSKAMLTRREQFPR